MGNLLAVLLVLAFVVGLITVVGHGIWMLLAWVFGGAKQAEKQLACVHCGLLTSHGLRYCTRCGRDLHSQLADELRDLTVVERELRRLARAGTIEPPEVESLLARVTAYRERLLHPEAAAPTPRPAAPPAARPPHPPAGKPPVEPVVDEVVHPEIIEEPYEYPVAAEPQESAPVAASQMPSPAVAKPQAAYTPKPQTAHPPVARPRPTPAPSSPPPRKSWSEMLAGFMEERNIRWGELIGGLLIVGPAIALVISFWEKLEENPYLQLTTFVSICSAVFGVGLYAHHRWRLRSTSLGLLIIATLLVPLNFLAMAAVWKENFSLGMLAADAVSLGIFFWLTALAGRVLVPGRHWLQVLAVLGGSAGVIVAAQCVAPDAPDWWYTAAACLPVACFAAAVVGAVVHVRGLRWSAPRRLDATTAAELFTLLGTGAFALAVAIAVFVERAMSAGASLDRLALPAALAAVPILAGGLSVRRGVARDRTLGAWYSAGTLVALTGAIVMLAALGLAWPQPGMIIAVVATECAVLVAAAFYWRLPLLHAGAVACGTIAYVLSFHAIYSGLPLVATDESGMGPRIVRLLFHGSTATALCGMFVICAAASEWLTRLRRRHHAAVYLGACGVLAALGLSLITVRGVELAGDDALRAAILYGIFGTISLLMAARSRERRGQSPFVRSTLRAVPANGDCPLFSQHLAYAGLGLLAAVPLWVLWRPATHHIGPLWAAVLAGEALAMAVLGVVLRVKSTLEVCSPSTPPDCVRGEGGFLAQLQSVLATPLLRMSELLALAALILAVATAWRDRVAIAAEHSLAPIAAATCLAALYFLLAWVQRSAERTWAGSMLVLAGLVHTFVCNYTEWFLQPWLMSLLVHSTLAMFAGLALEEWAARRWGKGGWGSQEGWGGSCTATPAGDARDGSTTAVPTGPTKILGHSLLDSAVVSSLLALPLLPFVPWEHTASLAACLYWLAAVWLVMAWRRGDPILFAAHQAMLTVATIVATTAWLKEQAWVERLPNDLLHPHSLQAYGITLGVLSLLWVVVRIAAGGFNAAKGTVPFSLGRKLGQSPAGAGIGTVPGARSGTVPSVDWFVRHALVWLQLVPLVLYLVPSVAQELIRNFSVSDSFRQMQAATCGSGAWWLLGVLTAAWIVALWHRWGHAELLDGFALLAVVPLLIAGRFSDDLAVASALRWGLAGTFVLASILVWNRGRLSGFCRSVRAKIEVSSRGPLSAQAALLATSALPALILTVVAAAIRLGGTHSGGPMAETFFHRLGPSVSYLIPLLLVTAGLVGFALRESSAVYAFAAGLVAEMTVALGYALHVVTGEDFHGSFTTGQQVTLLQLVTITAAAWALAWLVARRWVNVWRETGPSPEVLDSTRRRAPGVSPGMDDEPSRKHPRADARGSPATWLMRVQLGMGVAGNIVLLGAALFALALLPPKHHAWTIAAGDLLGWIAVATAGAAVAYRTVQTEFRLHAHVIGPIGLAFIGLLACTVRSAAFEYDFDPASGYRTLMLGWAAYALLIAAAAWWTTGVLMPARVLRGEGVSPARAAETAAPQGPSLAGGSTVWICVAGALAVLLALKAAAFHPEYEELLWSAAVVAIAGSAAATTALWRRRETWAVAAVAAMNLAVSLVTWYYYVECAPRDEWWAQLVQINAACLAVCSMAWSLLWKIREAGCQPAVRGAGCQPAMADWQSAPRAAPADWQFAPRAVSLPAPLAHVTAIVSVGLPLMLVALGVMADAFRHPQLRLEVEPLNWITLGAAAAAAIVLLWDRTARFVPAALYTVGLAAVGTALCASQLSPRAACWRSASDLAGFVLGAAALGWLLPRLRPTWQKLRIPDEPDRWPDDWFHGLQAMLIVVGATLCAWVAIEPAFDAIGREIALLGLYGRMNGGAGALMLLGATILMAWQATGERRTNWQYAAFAAGVLFSCTNTWARLETAAGTLSGDQPWVHCCAALMIATGMMTLLSSFGLRLVLPKQSDWLSAGRRIAPLLGGATVVMVLVVLGQEAYLFQPHDGAPVAPWLIAAVGVALVGSIVACLALALGGRQTPSAAADGAPSQPSIDGRVYVYAAEVLLALTVLHVRLTMPWLFNLGILKTYWILIVMAVAFCAVGLSELFHRRRTPVLAEPLERTALLLPIVPALGFWFMKETDAAAWFVGGGSPAAWFLIGSFYALMAIHKRSLPLAAVGIVAGNVGLWVLWHQCGLDFLDRPQLWLIPLALAALVAEHLDRRRLTPEQRAAIRYLALGAIYVSSTTEFWRGIGHSVVLPLVTIVLSVLGMLAGILLRVRSFLYLGVTFLLVVIARMIFYAAFERGHVWVFWASCIVLGAAIITLFALFEKRRNDVLAALERFKKWEQ